MRRCRGVFSACFLFAAAAVLAQTNPPRPLEDEAPKSKKADPPFKSTRLGNAQSIDFVKKNHLDIRISQRFGKLYDATNPHPLTESFQTFLGFDNTSDIRLSFDYGLRENLSIGLGRSKYNRLVDGNVKWKLLSQTADFKIPVSIVLFESIGYTHAPTTQLYSGIVKDFETNELHRFNYVSQLVIASRLSSRLSVEVVPGYIHRNFIRESYNTNSKAADQNGFLFLGLGARLKISQRVCIIGDYFYNFAAYYQNNSSVHQPLSLGIELETGGHLVSLFYSNASAFTENNYLAGTSDSWRKGQIKFGFSISRMFAL
jgi:hypothetical protein